MSKINKLLCSLFRNALLILVLVALLFIILFNTELCATCANICYSIVAAGIFYYVDVRLPKHYNKRAYKNIISHQLLLIVETLRLCREVVVKFDFNIKSRNEYVEIFSKYNLHEKSFSRQLTILEYINIKKEQARSIIISLLSYSQYLDFEEQKILLKILDTPFFKNDIIAIDYNVPDNLLENKYNNQKEIGESIYDNYELAKNFNLTK